MLYGSQGYRHYYSHFALQEISVNNSLSQDSNAFLFKVHYLTVASLIFSSFTTALNKIFIAYMRLAGLHPRGKSPWKTNLCIYIFLSWKGWDQICPICSCCEDQWELWFEDGQISRQINREPLKMTEITITQCLYHHSQDVRNWNENEDLNSGYRLFSWPRNRMVLDTWCSEAIRI